MRQVPKFSGLAVAAVLAALAAIPIVVRLGTAASTAIPILVAIVSLVAPAILTYSQRTGEVATRPDDPREAEAEPSFAARRARCGIKPDESLSVLGVVRTADSEFETIEGLLADAQALLAPRDVPPDAAGPPVFVRSAAEALQRARGGQQQRGHSGGASGASLQQPPQPQQQPRPPHPSGPPPDVIVIVEHLDSAGNPTGDATDLLIQVQPRPIYSSPLAPPTNTRSHYSLLFFSPHTPRCYNSCTPRVTRALSPYY